MQSVEPALCPNASQSPHEVRTAWYSGEGTGLHILSSAISPDPILRPALGTLLDNFTESVVDAALEASATHYFSAAFVGDLLGMLYERQRVARMTSAVRRIEDFVISWTQNRRFRAAQQLVREMSEAVLAQAALTEELDNAASFIQRCWRRHAVCTKARAALQDRQRQQEREREAAAEEQERLMVHRGAVRLQCWARCMCARLRVARLSVERSRVERAVVVREAARLVCSSLRMYCDRRKYLRKRQDRRLATSATVLQASARWRMSSELVAALWSRQVSAAVVRLQSWARMCVAVQSYRAQRNEAERERRTVRVLEAVVRLQSYLRRFLAQRRYQKIRARLAAVPLLQRIGRGFATRILKISKNRHRERAARVLQRFCALIGAKKLRAQRRRWEAERRQMAFVEYAARAIQRAWVMHVARRVASQRAVLKLRCDAARLRLQRVGKTWAAKCALARLRRAAQDAEFVHLAELSAVRIQTNVRGWIARERVAGLKASRFRAMKLIAVVAQNYLFRKDLAMYYLRHKRTLAARKIQLAYRNWQQLRRADRRHKMRLAYVRGLRQRDLAAAKVQSEWRRFAATRAYAALRRRRHLAAIKIQTQVRILFAKQILDSLIDEYRRDLAARRIQMMWLAVVSTFREKRAIREYEAELVQMEGKALVRSEAAHRQDIEQTEAAWRSRESYRYQVVMQSLADAYAERLHKWAERNPPEQQQEAAIKIQSHIRGLLARREHERQAFLRDAVVFDDTSSVLLESFFATRKSSASSAHARRRRQHGGHDECGSDDGERQLSTSVVPDSAVAAPTRGVDESGDVVARALRLVAHGLTMRAPSLPCAGPPEQQQLQDQRSASKRKAKEQGESEMSPSSWLTWLAARPHLRSRAMERLLLREASARRHLAEACEVTLALLSAQLAAPEGSHVRPLEPLMHRYQQIGEPSSAVTRTVELLYPVLERRSSIREAAPTTGAALVVSDQQRGTAVKSSYSSVVLPPLLLPSEAASLLARGAYSTAERTYTRTVNEVVQRGMDALASRGMLDAFSRISVNEGEAGAYCKEGDGESTTDTGTEAPRITPCMSIVRTHAPRNKDEVDDDDASEQEQPHEAHVNVARGLGSPSELRASDARSTAAVSSSGVCDLSNLNMSDVQLRLIFEKLRANTVFHTLIVDNNRLTDAVAPDLAELMTLNRSLVHYSLQNTLLTDIGATHVVNALMRANHIVAVSLGATHVTQSYLQYVTHVLQRSHARRLRQRAQEEALANPTLRSIGSGGGGSTAPSTEAALSRGTGGANDESALAIESSVFAGIKSLPPRLPSRGRVGAAHAAVTPSAVASFTAPSLS